MLNISIIIIIVFELRRAKAIAISRSYLSGIEEEILAYKLCGYCDASLTVYAAVIYLLIETESDSYMRFVASKTRVAPLKKQSIPWLELLSAILLSRLIVMVSMVLKSEITISATVCFTDSNVTLHWI